MAQVVSGGRVAWLYQARRVFTAAGGGGAIKINIALATGQVAKIVSMKVDGPASAGATLDITVADEDGATHAQLATCGAGANRSLRIPSIGGAASSSGNLMDTNNLLIGPGQVVVSYASTSLDTETMTLALTWLLFNVSTLPTWTTTGSGGTGTLAANTISAANELQMVLV